ncbi:MAG: hypothetical protein QM723_34185 [Myxococcaceae bacterium]
MLSLLLAACLPAVGPAVDGGSGGGGGTGGGGSATGGGSPAGCSDHQRDGDESDVDCGGSCAGCAFGLSCTGAGDCASGVCLSNQCANVAAPCTSFSACTTFDDYTTTAATITFGSGNNVYTPKCIKVKLGQLVSFQGNFSNHPLRQACGPIMNMLEASTGQGTDFTFGALGTYGYYCDMHGSSTGGGMAGAIEVVR